MAEQWKPVVDYVGLYEVSDLGRVRSVDRVVEYRDGRRVQWSGMALAPRTDLKGYARVNLCRNSVRTTFLVHRLVLVAFRGPCPAGMEACHGPAGNGDNSLTNLRWDTHGRNIRDLIDGGHHNNGRKTTCKRGHPFTTENTRVLSRGARACLTCERTRERRTTNA